MTISRIHHTYLVPVSASPYAYYHSLFSYSLPAHNLHLPSFPTRRSSDLTHRWLIRPGGQKSRPSRSAGLWARRSALVSPRRLLRGRATSPWRRIESATVFLLIRHPASRSRVVIGGDPSRPWRRANS